MNINTENGLLATSDTPSSDADVLKVSSLIPFHDALGSPKKSYKEMNAMFSSFQITGRRQCASELVVYNKMNEMFSSLQIAGRRQYASDLVVVLDMDECLIHRIRYPWTAKSADCFRAGKMDINPRPGLRRFLKAVSDRFETHIFTAAGEKHANLILDQLDPDNTMFSGRWYRDSCRSHELTQWAKDLEILPVDLSRTVLVDNNTRSFVVQPHNGILVKDYTDDPLDTSLDSVWDLLLELDKHDDVRPVLRERTRCPVAEQDDDLEDTRQVRAFLKSMVPI